MCCSAERIIVYILKFIQFVLSGVVVFCLFQTIPHWIFVCASMAVPIFGVYLLIKSTRLNDRHIYVCSNKYRHLIRVDCVISITMSIVYLGFSALLFVCFFQLEQYRQNRYLLLASFASFVATLAYVLNSAFAYRQLRISIVDFSINSIPVSKSISIDKKNQLHQTLPLDQKLNEHRNGHVIPVIGERPYISAPIPIDIDKQQQSPFTNINNSFDSGYRSGSLLIISPPSTTIDGKVVPTVMVNESMTQNDQMIVTTNRRSDDSRHNYDELSRQIIDYLRVELDDSLNQEVTGSMSTLNGDDDDVEKIDDVSNSMIDNDDKQQLSSTHIRNDHFDYSKSNRLSIDNSVIIRTNDDDDDCAASSYDKYTNAATYRIGDTSSAKYYNNDRNERTNSNNKITTVYVGSDDDDVDDGFVYNYRSNINDYHNNRQNNNNSIVERRLPVSHLSRAVDHVVTEF